MMVSQYNERSFQLHSKPKELRSYSLIDLYLDNNWDRVCGTTHNSAFSNSIAQFYNMHTQYYNYYSKVSVSYFKNF